MANKRKSVSMSDELWEKIEGIALKKDRSVSYIIRQAIEKHIRDHLNFSEDDPRFKKEKNDETA